MGGLRGAFGFAAALAIAAGCGGDGDGAAPDAGYPPVTLDHCAFAPIPPTARAGGQVVAGPLRAGAAEAPVDIPVSTALGSYTARANFLGTSGKVDLRRTDINGAFNPSIGVETRMWVKALALEAGGEKVVLLHVDLGFPYEGFVFDLEQRLGPDYSGKVIITASHSHSAWGQYSAHAGIGGVGAGRVQRLVYHRFLDAFEQVARAAIANAQPARIGFFFDGEFDPDDQINRDRRGENDALAGGPRDDNQFFLIRVDAVDGAPIAALPVFGIHGTLQDADNSFASTDAPGGIERVFQEAFDRPVVVMHLQGAGGDVSPVGHGEVDCAVRPGNPDDPCWTWLKNEGLGRVALPYLVAAYDAAGARMTDTLAIEMLTRSVELGPDPDTFTVRDGALRYAVWDRYTPADRRIWADDGSILSPIDEFNAPVGAALCEADYPVFPAGALAGTDELPPYGSCVTIDVAGSILGELLDLRFEAAPDKPVCQSTRTTVSALRLGDYLIATMPGEVTTLIADRVRAASPMPPDKTIVLGYAQGEMGYILTPEDWLQGGYESSINFWGPLEGEYLVERLAEVMAMAATPEREDAAEISADRYVTPELQDDFTVDVPAVAPGTIPADADLPDNVWTRTGPATRVQPLPQIERVSGLAQFVWIGEHPAASTPVVTLQREASPGVFADVVRRSGRPVQEGDILLAYTPLPLRPDPGEPRTHYWVAEWQAVPWLGSGELDALDRRVAVPLGRYRFHVTSPTYELFSDPFEVVPATLDVSATASGTRLDIAVRIAATKGFRLMSLTAPSNGPLPVKNGVFRVQVERTGGPVVQFDDVAGDAGGHITVDLGSDASAARRVTVTDAWGNTGSVDL
ncbi:MAG: hypothetical protein D6689_09805 [Deltaproteobacteria bacterium]|nr:MAG: hypothetical protein D6689_09805 [Deltaproteobacteria bacterium]